jgi:hypothetical protein
MTKVYVISVSAGDYNSTEIGIFVSTVTAQAALSEVTWVTEDEGRVPYEDGSGWMPVRIYPVELDQVNDDWRRDLE